MQKQKLLVIGITMNAAGSEKSFLSFANCLDYEKFDVTLLLAKKAGPFLPKIPPQVRVIELPEYGEMFTLDGANATKTILHCFVRKNPLLLFEIFPYFIKTKLFPKKAHDTATRLWCRLMRHMPPLPGEYDAALAYWGDKTMFYMCDKVTAKHKIAWLHFDYEHPPRDDKTYFHYFNACDRLVTVSDTINRSLQCHFPALREKCVHMENIIDAKDILQSAENGKGFPDSDYTGLRILTVGRIAEQKGYDMAVTAMQRLCADGIDARWYILGEGTPADVAALRAEITAAGLETRIRILPRTNNPYRLMRDCDIYAQPSRHEGKPIAVEEAKILEKPILVTNYLSAGDQLLDGKHGMICAIDADSIYKGLKELCLSPQKRAEYKAVLAKSPKGNAEEMQVFYEMLQTLDREKNSAKNS